jgi:putative photosynthetic complex assembly protein 2
MNSPNLWAGAVVTLFAWWFSTGLILMLVRAPRRYHKLLLLGFGVVGAIAFWGLIVSASQNSPPAIYCGFLCALIVWGWHEASFLMGIITGPRPHPCPEGAKGWQRFIYAAGTLIYHEVALFVTLLAIGVATWQAPNQVAIWTFATLFMLRLSSKFNIFLGVPNLTEEFFPDHLAHLKSYLPKQAMNPLMPLSIIVCLGALVWQWRSLAALPADNPVALAWVIIFALTALGLLEHVFMITPIPDALLWRWAMGGKKPTIAPANHAKNNKNA